MITLSDLLPWFSLITAIGTFVGTFAVMKYRIGQVEKRREEDKQDFKEQLAAVNMSKHSKFKEVKEDYNEKIQVAHTRVDKLRDEVRDSNQKIEQKIETLGEKIDRNHEKLLETVTNLITKNKT